MRPSPLARHATLRNRLTALIGLPEEIRISWLRFFLALHDLGKFSFTFQDLRPEILCLGRNDPELKAESKYSLHHSSMGYVLWQAALGRLALRASGCGEAQAGAGKRRRVRGRLRRRHAKDNGRRDGHGRGSPWTTSRRFRSSISRFSTPNGSLRNQDARGRPERKRRDQAREFKPVIRKCDNFRFALRANAIISCHDADGKSRPDETSDMGKPPQ